MGSTLLTRLCLELEFKLILSNKGKIIAISKRRDEIIGLKKGSHRYTGPLRPYPPRSQYVSRHKLGRLNVF